MPAYLVRTIDDHDIVGFFVADEMDDLLIAVDECTEPEDCEAPMPRMSRARRYGFSVMTCTASAP
jgi:hypothetical protein